MTAHRSPDTTLEESGRSLIQLPGGDWADRLYPFFGCAALLLCIWIAHPFANLGFNDEPSYAYVIGNLLRTGHIEYGNCCNAMALFQSYWGAAWIRLLGFSFNLLRFISIPFSLGFVLLVYALGRSAGLSRSVASFGSIVVATSPLFVPLAASFMTEPYACFFGTLCMYAAIRSAQTPNGRNAILWLWVLTIAGIMGGSDRQSVWAAPVSLIPYLCWVRRSDRRFLIHAAASYALTVAALVFLVTHFYLPYGPVASGPTLAGLVANNWAVGLVYLLCLTLATSLISLPVLLCAAPLWKNMRAAGILTAVVVSSTITALLLVNPEFTIAPFLGNMMSSTGIMHAGQDGPGFKPHTLPLAARLCLTVLVLFSVIAAFRLSRLRRRRIEPNTALVFAVFSLTYVLLLVPGALLGVTFDRYLLPLFPVTVIALLSIFVSRRVPAPAWACLLAFAIYSIATTHDYFSALRARLAAAETVERHGIPRTHISAGFEYDVWTQLSIAGRMETYEVVQYRKHNARNSIRSWNAMKAITADYFAMTAKSSEVPAHSLAVVPFTDWFPPFKRVVVVVKREDLPQTGDEL